jgi:hypothetical protein
MHAMTTSSLKSVLPAALAFWLLAPVHAALADSNDGMHSRYRPATVYHRLPPEQHVVEGVRPPGSGTFLINGRYFAAATPSCMRWLPGDRIKLLRGDWNGYCDTAVFRNLRRGGTCEMWCR